VGYGFTQFVQFAIFAGLFYFGAVFMERDYPEVSSNDVFIAMFAIMFGAQQLGTAFAMGPDAGKAEVAAQKVFRIIEKPSTINAIEMDDKSEGKRLSVEDVKGKVEFRNVWFRYPTRPEEFVLRGMNLEIDPGESVALVGESGCGKSTFINLLMRFYDPEFGEVLLDDVDIKEYNLHDLRTVISLVMQEPIVFNYSIVENILYGKLQATNTEVQTAAD
jgi:ATP-binding cassette subfamily B (MDR/TAP) protein 1